MNASRRLPVFGVVGYSTRALVEALSDFGIPAISIDAFGDQDTHDMAREAYVVDGWPEGIVSCAKKLKVDAWLMAGGMENCFKAIDQLSQLAPVLGPRADSMRELRSLSFWRQIADGIEGIAFPKTHVGELSTVELSERDSWLFKPHQGSGGLLVQSADALSTDAQSTEHSIHENARAGYYQQFISGRVLGVTWIIDQHDVQLTGVTESLSESQWPGPSRFIYRGSIGPVPIRASARNELLALARRVQQCVGGYRGWLQADLIEDESGRLWLLELNPRWTAGMEILHQCAAHADASPLAGHLRAWGWPADLIESHSRVSQLAAKAVYYARSTLVLTGREREQLQSLRKWHSRAVLPGATRDDNHCVECSLADLPMLDPQSERSFVAGEPVLSVRVRVIAGGSPEDENLLKEPDVQSRQDGN